MLLSNRKKEGHPMKTLRKQLRMTWSMSYAGNPVFAQQLRLVYRSTTAWLSLDGHVGSLYEKWAAERTALRVANVTSVASEIIVDLPFGSEWTDEEIASAATSHLRWNFQVPDTIKLKSVERLGLTLQGSVEWQYQRQEAETGCKVLTRSESVTNEIDLKPTLSAHGGSRSKSRTPSSAVL